MADFPAHPDAVTADWLGSITGTRVASVTWEPIGTGQVGDSVRFHIDYEGARGPATLAGKFPASDPTSRATAAMFGLYRREVEFYRRAAPMLAVRVPWVRFADVSADGAEFILLFEDLAPARGGDQIAGCSVEDARFAMRQAAAIHAPSWGRADILEAEWVQAPDRAEQVGEMYAQAQALFRDRYAAALEPELMQLCDGLAESATLWFRRQQDPQCLIHGDFRLDNMLFGIRNGEEEIAILDWQTASVGRGMTDVAYFLGCGIGNALRRAHEDALLDLYLAEMARRGVALSRAEVWHDYRLGALHGISTAVFSAAFVERTERGDANFLSMARGACALALEHDSIGALRGEG